ncbi:efflux transporter outer membrane subunit [Pseudomonas sp. MAFF212427]|uniref:Efflux transporter outer membrane subunit n=1 Tax=Pseudomonas brassicae TaxID=2708063 RepID=A0A6B3NXK1_9PSED|nr:efflux transporter outer membrane subunit [Pseudomonas brassicae]NER65008.1 efflux transporter outer membrane subunit [Pseudomonas brassicae]
MKHALLLMAMVGLGACSVGPDLQTPRAALPASWGVSVPAGSTLAARLDSHWWAQLGDPQLTALVEQAAAANFDVRVAANRLEQSRLLRQVTGSQQVPGISAATGYTRERNSGVGLNDPSGQAGKAPFERWSTALDASWEVDLWGHVRRAVEAADAQVALSAAQRDGVQLSIAAETASNYIRLRGVQARLAVARKNLEIARQSSQLTQTRFDNGVTTNLDTANAAAQVASIEAVLPVLGAQQDRLINALSYLLGKPPQALSAKLIKPRSIPHPAPDVPLGLPSELAQRRPDIRQSEAELHRATAAIGVAMADFYPRISLGASLGMQAQHGADLGTWSSREWSYGPSLYLPIFQGGRLTGTLELRQRQQQQAALNYQRVVLGAWHEVDNAMHDYAAEKQHHQALQRAVAQNNIALSTARARYAEGAVDFINVLGVQRSLLATQSELVDSATEAALDRVRLYRALGGGWPVQADFPHAKSLDLAYPGR